LDTDTIEVGDVVFEDFTINNEYIRFNPAQKWYYVSEQQASEAWVFVQGDADPHTRHGIQISITTYCLSLTYVLGKEFLIRRFRYQASIAAMCRGKQSKSEPLLISKMMFNYSDISKFEKMDGSYCFCRPDTTNVVLEMQDACSSFPQASLLISYQSHRFPLFSMFGAEPFTHLSGTVTQFRSRVSRTFTTARIIEDVQAQFPGSPCNLELGTLWRIICNRSVFITTKAALKGLPRLLFLF
jgi:hypothetical protein